MYSMFQFVNDISFFVLCYCTRLKNYNFIFLGNRDLCFLNIQTELKCVVEGTFKILTIRQQCE